MAEVIPTTSMEMIDMNGEMVDLGFSIGALTEDSITWNEDGVNYVLFSTDLSPDEMVMVAQSVQGGAIK